MSSENIDVNDYANSTLSFPQKLFILLEVDKTGLITWASHGMCFRIEDPDKFAEDIVPRYFKQTKLTSFQRQLNLYGFRRLSKGEDQGCYFHPKFQKERPDLLMEVHRLPAKGSLESYEEIQFTKQKELTFDYDRTKSKKRARREEKKVVDKQTNAHSSPTFVGHAVSPVSTARADDCSVSSLSSGEHEFSCSKLPASRADRFKGPYLFLGCGAPKSISYDEQLHQYQLYEQQCRDRVAAAHQQYRYYQQDQVDCTFLEEVFPAPMFVPYPISTQYDYIPPATSGFVPMTDTTEYSEIVDQCQLDYSFLKPDMLDMLLNSSQLEQQEQVPLSITDSKEDWADSLLSMPWVTASSDDYDNVI